MRGIRLWGLRVASVVAVLIGAAERGEADPIRPTPRYSVTELRLPSTGNERGEAFSEVFDLNNRGDVLGMLKDGRRVIYSNGVYETFNDGRIKFNDLGQSPSRDDDYEINIWARLSGDAWYKTPKARRPSMRY